MFEFASGVGRSAIAVFRNSALPFTQPFAGMSGGFSYPSGGSSLNFWQRVWERGLSGAGGTTDNYDINESAGDVRLNSLVTNLHILRMNALREAPPVLQRRDKLGRWQYEITHPLLDVLYTPNDFTDWPTLLIDTDAEAFFTGNAYWYKRRNRYGDVIGLYLLPSYAIAPRWDKDSGNWIDYYLYNPTGSGETRIKPADIVHFRGELQDPNNNRLGRSRMQSLLADICVDREDSTATAFQAHNLGAPGAVIAPETDDGAMDEETAKKIERSYKARTSGRKRGLPLVLSSPMKITTIGAKPSDMVNDRAMLKASQRIFGAYQIHPVLMGGERGNFAMITGAQEMMWELGILPAMRNMAGFITSQLLPDFEPLQHNAVRMAFDIREVRALTEDTDKLHDRSRNDWRWNCIDLDTYLQETGRTPIGGEVGNMRYSNFVAAQARANLMPGGGTQSLPSGGGTGKDPAAHGQDGQDPTGAKLSAFMDANMEFLQLASIGADVE